MWIDQPTSIQVDTPTLQVNLQVYSEAIFPNQNSQIENNYLCKSNFINRYPSSKKIYTFEQFNQPIDDSKIVAGIKDSHFDEEEAQKA